MRASLTQPPHDVFVPSAHRVVERCVAPPIRRRKLDAMGNEQIDHRAMSLRGSQVERSATVVVRRTSIDADESK